MKIRNAVVSLMSCLIFSACYTRQPLASVEPAPSTRIIAQLTDTGTVAMGNSLGAGALEVEGVVSSASADKWTLQMLRVDHRDGRSIPWNRELVSFPRAVLSQPAVVVLDKKRTWLAAAGITIGAFVLARAFDVVSFGDDDEEGPQPQESVIGGRRP